MPSPEVGVPVTHDLELTEIRTPEDVPSWLSLDQLTGFLHESMRPYEDTSPDVRRALDYALSTVEGKGGFILVAGRNQRPQGVVVILDTGMSGYIPEYVLVFVSVLPSERGKGIGAWIIRAALERCRGEVKLHVEYDNPAKRLYERLGFKSKYAEMRISVEGNHEPRDH